LFGETSFGELAYYQLFYMVCPTCKYLKSLDGWAETEDTWREVKDFAFSGKNMGWNILWHYLTQGELSYKLHHCSTFLKC
jgi:hypothetical protein